MAEICLFGVAVFDDAAEGPMGLKVWPPSSLEPTLRAYRGRILREGYQVNFNGKTGFTISAGVRDQR